MSILDEIKKALARCDLYEIGFRDLRAPDARYRRWIYISPDIYREMRRRSSERSFRKLSAQFQNFLMGRTVPIALELDHKQAQWARLDPQSDEVWECRVRQTDPELRVVGRFASADVFIALDLYERPELKGRKKWAQAKVRCQCRWASLFPCHPPLHGRFPHDYVRANFTVI